MEDRSPIFPEDIFQQIIKFADDKTKRAWRLASTKLFKLVNYTKFTIYFARAKTLRSIITRLSKYSSLIGLELICPKNIPLEELFRVSILTNLSSLAMLEVQIPTSVDIWFKLTTLSNLHRFDSREYPFNLNASFTQLTALDIPRSAGSNVSILTNLRNIQKLSIQVQKDSPIYTILDYIQKPSRLTSLSITGDPFTYSADQVSKFSNLKVLRSQEQKIPYQVLTSLEHLQFDDHLDSIEILTNLTTLHLNQNFIRMPPDHVQMAIKKLTALVRLKEFSIYQAIHEFDLEILRPLTALELLDLGRSSFSPENLQKISSTRLTALSARLQLLQRSHISHLTSLRQLQGKPTDLFLPLESIQDLTNLTSLIVTRGQVTDNLAYLTTFKSLEALHGLIMPPDSLIFLGSNIKRLTFDVPPEYLDSSYELLTKFPLEMLDMKNTGHAIWSTLSKLTDLASLGVNKAFSDSNIESLTCLTRLTFLSVHDPVSTAPFTKLSTLQFLFVSFSSGSHSFNRQDLSNMPRLRHYF